MYARVKQKEADTEESNRREWSLWHQLAHQFKKQMNRYAHENLEKLWESQILKEKHHPAACCFNGKKVQRGR